MPFTDVEERRVSDLEAELNEMRRTIRDLAATIRTYEQNGLQASRFKNLSEQFAAAEHTH